MSSAAAGKVEGRGAVAAPRRGRANGGAVGHARAIRVALADDRALAKKLADEGLRRLPRFGLARMAADMEKVYDSLA